MTGGSYTNGPRCVRLLMGEKHSEEEQEQEAEEEECLTQVEGGDQTWESKVSGGSE